MLHTCANFGGLPVASHLRVQPWVSASLHNLEHFFTLSHSLPLNDSHLNTGLLIAKIQADLVRNKANKMVNKIQPYNDPSPRPKRTQSSSGVYDPHKFRYSAAFQTHENYFRDATPIVERAVDQPSFRKTNIPIWFATKDWNFLLFDLNVAYVNMVREFWERNPRENKIDSSTIFT